MRNSYRKKTALPRPLWPILGCFFSISSFAVSLSLGARAALAGEAIVPRSGEERLSYIDQAATWRPIDTANLDVMAVPAELIGNKGYEFGQTIRCTFIEPDSDPDPFGEGQTPKFHCMTPNGKSIKVKYGLKNSEVYGEIAGSRLLWALGFGSDANYSVRVECDHCPRDPWTWITMSRGERALFASGVRPRNWADKATLERKLQRGRQLFLPATVEVKFKGDKVESREDQGWTFPEFRHIFGTSDPAAAEERVHRHALALLLGTIGYADSKDGNQRLVCLQSELALDGKSTCHKSFLLAHDLGWTFGNGYNLLRPTAPSKMRIDQWRDLPVWRDSKACLTEVHPIVAGTLRGIPISEAGRMFLLGRYALLSRTQKIDVFRAARVEFQQYSGETHEKWGSPEEWVDILDQKFAEISRVRCPK